MVRVCAVNRLRKKNSAKNNDIIIIIIIQYNVIPFHPIGGMDGSGVYHRRVSCKIGTRAHGPRFDGLTSANIMTFPSTSKHHTLPPRHYYNTTISERFFQRWSWLYYNIVHHYNKIYCLQLCIIMCVRDVQASARAEKYENPSRAK